MRSGGANVVDYGFQNDLLAGLANSVLEIDGIVDFGCGSVGLEIPADPAAANFHQNRPVGQHRGCHLRVKVEADHRKIGNLARRAGIFQMVCPAKVCATCFQIQFAMVDDACDRSNPSCAPTASSPPGASPTSTSEILAKRPSRGLDEFWLSRPSVECAAVET